MLARVTRPLDLIACPLCHGGLAADDDSWRCERCGREFGGDGRLDLTPNPPPDEELRERWPLWEQLQANFLAAATAVPEHSLSVTARPDAEAFARFCRFSGTVLDIGCGTQRLPTYADTTACRFIGLDPLPGEPERDFEFVQGIGEYLPFRSNSVDQVLFGTSLDHMLVPRRALAEAQRVLRPGGAVNVWFGELDRDSHASRLRRVVRRARETAAAALGRGTAGVTAAAEPDYLARLEQPDGAIDKFHVAHPDATTIARWFAEVGLELGDVERVDYASGCFMRGVKPEATAA
jgi:SAM-dependent methyltransferase